MMFNETYSSNRENATLPTVNDTNMADDTDYTVIINGYILPLLAIVVLVTNAVVIVVLKRQQTYGASQAGLVGIAVSDSLTLILPAPFYFYSYGLGNYVLVGSWCQTMDWIALYLPTISHTASIWLTVLLTLQRYFYVCQPFKARGWCTLRNTKIGIVTIYVLSLLVHLCRFFVFEYWEGSYIDSVTNKTEEYCGRNYREWVDLPVYLSCYMGVRIVFIQFVPCVFLILLNFKILHGLRTVTNKRLQLHTNAESNKETIKENMRVTVMIISMAAITLLVEFPAGIIQFFYTFPFMFGFSIIDDKKLAHIEIIANLVIIFTYALNFLLYCSMSAEFKATLKELCWGSRCDGRSYRKGCKKIPNCPSNEDGLTNCTKV